MLTMRLQDEKGKPESDGDIGISFLPKDDPSLRLLCYVDPYGDTVFNRLQMDAFLADWEQIRPEAKTPEEMDAWIEAKALAARCKDEVHLYLRFIGD